MGSDHFLRGALLSTVLNILAVAAAIALGLRARLGGRAELATATIVTWNFLVMCPVYALGLTGHLEARTLALTSGLWFLLVLAIARGRAPLRTFGADLGRAALAIARLPLDALVVCARARSLVTIGVAFTIAFLVWTFACAYLTPAWKQWDSLWYHEPMVGFAIQNHGFRMADLPGAEGAGGGAQKINGYPRLCEMTQLWFVIFTDRRVIDMVGHVAAPALALCTYVLARRYTRHVTLAIALGCALVLMPASVRLLGSTYVDVHNAAFIVAAAHFCTRPDFRIRDAALAAICLTLAVGSKSLALVPAAVLSLVAAVRVLRHVRRRPLASVGILALGVTLIGGMAATIYVRNWIHFRNPFWPDLKYDNDKWGIHWPGSYDWSAFGTGTNRINMNLPFSVLLEDIYSIPYSNVPSGPYSQMYEYGIAVMLLIVPIALVASVALCVTVFRDLLGRAIGRADWRAAPETFNIVPLAATSALMLRVSPALWGARYQVAAVAVISTLVAWAAGRRELRPLGEGVAGALTVMSIMSFFWLVPRTWLRWSEAVAFARIPYPAREVTPAADISPNLPIWNGSAATKAAGLARESELTAGTVLAFPGNYGIYMALFWNNEYSNQIVFVPEAHDFVGEVNRTNAKWTYCATGDPICLALSAADSGWERIGPLDVENHGTVFRRTR
jgi:hypothetical protein